VTDLLDQLIVDTPAKRWLRMYLDHQEKEFCLIWPFTRAQNGYPMAGGNGVVRGRRSPRRAIDLDALRAGCSGEWRVQMRRRDGHMPGLPTVCRSCGRIARWLMM
jgi:hypothetical protein